MNPYNRNDPGRRLHQQMQDTARQTWQKQVDDQTRLGMQARAEGWQPQSSGSSVIGPLLGVALFFALVAAGIFLAVNVISRDTPSLAERASLSGTTSDSVNVRRGPSADFPVVTTLSEGTDISIRCKFNDDWLMLKEPHAGMFIAAAYVRGDRDVPGC
jgi:hypothetical protein